MSQSAVSAKGKRGRGRPRKVATAESMEEGKNNSHRVTESTGGAEEERVMYAFESPVLCPRCRARTLVTTTRGPYQYRQCTNPVCRRRFRVTGRRVQ